METLKRTPATHARPGVVHCGVTREGFIAVGGDPRDIEDGQEVLFERVAIKASRQGSEYPFTRVTQAG
jgi:hypothetical protein